MPGFSDFQAQAALNDALGPIPSSTAYSRFLALFTTAPTGGSGSGGVEVSASGYARIQIAGRLTAGAGSSGTTVNLGSSAPAWLTALGTNGSGVNVYDATTSTQIGTVSTISGTTVTLTATAGGTVSSGDALQFSAFPQAAASSGTEPSITPVSGTSGAQISFAAFAASSGTITITALGVYDAATGGNLRAWDYLNLSGAGKWSPFACSSASPGVLTVTDQSFANGTSVVVAVKFGSLPSLASGSWSGLLTVGGVSGSTFNVGLNTTSAGDGMIRPVTPLIVGLQPTTPYFPAGTLTFSLE